MEVPAAPLLAWSRRPDVRLAAFGLAATAAVYIGFIGISASTAETLIRRGGYYVMLGVFGGWIWTLLRLWRRREPSPGWTRREALGAAALIVLLTGVAVGHETFQSKILYDEFVLQSTAFNMHFFREVAVMVRGYDILGTFVSTDNYLDKRPYFFPFLVSLVHDLTGYRPLNAHLLNAVLLPVALTLSYLLGRGLAGARGGLLAVALLGTLPLLAQNATGSGMELVNVTMLLAAVLLGGAFLARPDEIRLSAFLLAVVLLVQCRYESALYVLSGAGVVAAAWWRERRIVLSWIAVITPLLLVPAALHNKVLSSSPVLWEMREAQSSRFGIEHVAGNLRGAWEFLFAHTRQHSNSLLLSAVGVAAVLWLAGRLLSRRPALHRLAPLHLAWLAFGCGVIATTTLMMFYFWASFMDPMASRFSLPLCVLLAFTAVACVGWLDRRFPRVRASGVLLGLAALYFIGISIPKQAQHRYSRLGIEEVEWEMRFVAARPPGTRLVLSNKSTLPWLLRQTPSILLDRARVVADRLRHQLEQGTFTEILVLQTLRPTSAEGDFRLMPDEVLPDGFRLEFVAEKRFGTRLSRISRLVAVAPATGETAE